MTKYEFAFARSYRGPALLFGITPRTAWVELDDAELRVRYGLWRLTTPVANITGRERSSGFSFVKTAGPPHLSFSDRGVSFTTNGDEAVCVSFRAPVPGIDPTRRIVHPAATLSLADLAGFTAHLDRLIEP